METDIVIVGAGIAGLTCARRLVDAGRSVLLLEKSRGVGGRCATRRIGNVLVDHGLTFYHGRDEKLRAVLESAGGDGIFLDWPMQIRGKGTPCQPGAFRKGDWRIAYTDGVNVFPKFISEGLDIRFHSRVTTIEPSNDRWRVADDQGRAVTSRDLVLAIPTPQILDLLVSLEDTNPELASMRFLLGETGYVSSLTVIAHYPAVRSDIDWDMWYPEDSTILQLLSHDSAKRRLPDRTVLVLQALPGWSGDHLENPEEEWAPAMLTEAGRLAGAWAAEPETVQTHRWRFARIIGGGELSEPMMMTFPGGMHLGFAGDGLSPGAGVQAAWRSGHAMAKRILEE